MQVVLGRTVLSNDVVRDAEMAVQEATDAEDSTTGVVMTLCCCCMRIGSVFD